MIFQREIAVTHGVLAAEFVQKAPRRAFGELLVAYVSLVRGDPRGFKHSAEEPVRLLRAEPAGESDIEKLTHGFGVHVLFREAHGVGDVSHAVFVFEPRNGIVAVPLCVAAAESAAGGVLGYEIAVAVEQPHIRLKGALDEHAEIGVLVLGFVEYSLLEVEKRRFGVRLFLLRVVVGGSPRGGVAVDGGCVNSADHHVGVYGRKVVGIAAQKAVGAEGQRLCGLPRVDQRERRYPVDDILLAVAYHQPFEPASVVYLHERPEH